MEIIFKFHKNLKEKQLQI